jgi:hypothetical protein
LSNKKITGAGKMALFPFSRLGWLYLPLVITRLEYGTIFVGKRNKRLRIFPAKNAPNQRGREKSRRCNGKTPRMTAVKKQVLNRSFPDFLTDKENVFFPPS